MALSRVVSKIFNVEKCHDLEIQVRGYSRSLKVVPFDRLSTISYWSSTITLCLRHTVFEIFDFKNVMTLKTGLWVRKGHHLLQRI